LWSQHHETSVTASAFSLRGSVVAPLDLHPNNIDHLVRQACYVLVAEVDGDAGVVLLHISGSIWASLADVLARVVEGGLCKGDHLLVRDGHRRVVAHDERRSERRAAKGCADMLMQRWGAYAAAVGAARQDEVRSNSGTSRASRGQAPPVPDKGWRPSNNCPPWKHEHRPSDADFSDTPRPSATPRRLYHSS
jgi:hypothetical protein